MRCLHIIDTLEPRGAVQALLRLLEEAATAAPGAGGCAHDVLAFATGPLETAVRAYVRRLTIVSTGLDTTAAVLARGYDVVHVLDRAAARRVAPLLATCTPATFVYSAPALQASRRHDAEPVEAADGAVLASCDLVVFAPVAGRAPDLAGTLVHRSVCLELARLVDAGSPIAEEARADAAAEAPFIAREWAAAITGAIRPARFEVSSEAGHP